MGPLRRRKPWVAVPHHRTFVAAAPQPRGRLDATEGHHVPLPVLLSARASAHRFRPHGGTWGRDLRRYHPPRVGTRVKGNYDGVSADGPGGPQAGDRARTIRGA